MLSRILILMLILFVSRVNCQNSEYKIELKLNDIQNKKLSLDEENLYLYNLKSLNQSTDSIYFRIITNKQIIDLSKTNNGEFLGFILNRITQYNYQKKDKKKLRNKVEFFQKVPIEESKVKEITNKLIASKQYDFPTDSLISIWNNNFLHCNTLNFQIKINFKLKRQTYNCVWGQDTANSIVSTIIENDKFITDELNLNSLYSLFTDNLPKGHSYSNDGYRMMYLFTKKENDAWLKSKPVRDYLSSKKDTIDNYLKLRLNQINIKNEKFTCFQNYNLEFCKKGKLKKLKVAKFDKPTLVNFSDLKEYFEEKKEIRKCKKIIRKIFINNDWTFLNLKYSINRSLDFDLNGNPKIYDNTIY